MSEPPSCLEAIEAEYDRRRLAGPQCLGKIVCLTNPEGLPIIPPREPAKVAADGAIAICGACGMRLFPVMGYSCSRDDCPVFPQVR